MQIEREQVIAVIKDFSDGLLAEKNGGHVTAETSDARVRGVLRQACERGGVTLDDYTRALESDPVLKKLEHDAVVQAIAGQTDPGPNDAISRESPSGQPGDLTKSRDAS